MPLCLYWSKSNRYGLFRARRPPEAVDESIYCSKKKQQPVPTTQETKHQNRLILVFISPSLEGCVHGLPRKSSSTFTSQLDAVPASKRPLLTGKHFPACSRHLVSPAHQSKLYSYWWLLQKYPSCFWNAEWPASEVSSAVKVQYTKLCTATYILQTHSQMDIHGATEK